MKIPEVRGLLVDFPLMRQPTARTIPMDYNYRKVDPTGAIMLADYQRSVVAAYRHPKRHPWSVGHHFALWQGGRLLARAARTARLRPTRAAPTEGRAAAPKCGWRRFDRSTARCEGWPASDGRAPDPDTERVACCAADVTSTMPAGVTIRDSTSAQHRQSPRMSGWMTATALLAALLAASGCATEEDVEFGDPARVTGGFPTGGSTGGVGLHPHPAVQRELLRRHLRRHLQPAAGRRHPQRRVL